MYYDLLPQIRRTYFARPFAMTETLALSPVAISTEFSPVPPPFVFSTLQQRDKFGILLPDVPANSVTRIYKLTGIDAHQIVNEATEVQKTSDEYTDAFWLKQ